MTQKKLLAGTLSVLIILSLMTESVLASAAPAAAAAAAGNAGAVAPALAPAMVQAVEYITAATARRALNAAPAPGGGVIFASAAVPTARPTKTPIPTKKPSITPTPTPSQTQAPVQLPAPTAPAKPSKTPSPTKAPTPASMSKDVVISFPGVNGVYIDYWSPSWQMSQWVTGTVAYNGSASLTLQDTYNSGRASANYYIAVRRGGMSYVFPERTVRAGVSNIFDVPIKTISIAGVKGPCQLALLQAGWNYQADWVSQYTPYSAGDVPSYTVFDNRAYYALYVSNPGAGAGSACIDYIFAGDTVDIGWCFW